MPLFVRAATSALFFATAALLGGGCAREIVGDPPPVDQPYFPTGLALHPDRPLLAVVSSNFDLAYNRGALLLADLDVVDAAIAAAEERVVVIAGAEAYTATAFVPSFGNEPVFVDGGDRLLLATRGENLVAEIPLALENGVGFDCGIPAGQESDIPVCGEGAGALQLQGNDPFELAVVEESSTRVEAIVTLLSSPIIFYVAVNLDTDGASRLSVEGGPSFSLEGYSIEGEARGVRGLALRPAMDGVPTTAFVTVNRTATRLATDAVDLVWFDATAPDDRRVLRTLPLTAEIGAIDARAVAVHPTGEAVFLLLRDPDALVRIDLTPEDGALRASVGGVVSTCYDPIEMAAVLIPTPDGDEEHRVIVTCFNNDTVLSYDALSLVEKETLRGFGEGPYGLEVDTAHVPPRAYVSYFSDDTVGVIDLVDDDGAISLVPRAVIGQPRVDDEGTL